MKEKCFVRPRFNSNGSHFVSGRDDKTVRIWKFVGSSDVLKKYADDSSDQTSHGTAHVHTFKGHGYPVQAVDISKDNTTIASAGGDRDVFLFDVGKGTLKRRLKTHKAAISSLSFNTLDNVLISGSYDRTACLWDFRTNSRSPIQILEDATDAVLSVSAKARLSNLCRFRRRCVADVRRPQSSIATRQL